MLDSFPMCGSFERSQRVRSASGPNSPSWHYERKHRTTLLTHQTKDLYDVDFPDHQKRDFSPSVRTNAHVDEDAARVRLNELVHRSAMPLAFPAAAV